MSVGWNVVIEGESAMVAFGERLGNLLREGVIFLEGQLGAGKTTLCRGILRARGYGGAVKSPTYTLVEPYELGDGKLYHFDLYRLSDPEELEFMGIRDYFEPGNLCIVEWPERGEGVLPRADLRVVIEVAGQGRKLSIMAQTLSGENLISNLQGNG
ncbi:MAG: tRNA (adenosine(37)-N6)-threonylcarbamoyltransferase complex ATPase subunit type 1 TsaE [Porticoccaceae bacterium]